VTVDDTPTGYAPQGDPRNRCSYGDVRFSPNYHDSAWATSTYAAARYKVDDIYGGHLGYIQSGGSWSEIGKTKTFKTYINTTGLTQGALHIVTIYLQDVGGGWCYRAADPYWIWGEIFKEATLNFIKCGNTEICGDGIDNNCDGEIDEGCGKILQYYSGSGQEGFICETIKEPFKVKVASSSGEPETGIGIGWEVKTQPNGAGASVTPTNSATNSEGLASTTLKLGISPGDYAVESTCSACTEGSPQTFTATAKCPDVPQYYQDDYSDDYDGICAISIDPNTNKKYGVKPCEKDAQGNVLSTEIPYTIADKGCALSSMSMVMGRYGMLFSPNSLNGVLTSDINGYTPEGDVWWQVVELFSGSNEEELQYVDRDVYKGSHKRGKPVTKSLMDDYLKKCMSVIAQVYNLTTGNMHWVVVTGKTGNDYTINDPSKQNNYKFLSQYGNIYNIRPYNNTNGGCQ